MYTNAHGCVPNKLNLQNQAEDLYCAWIGFTDAQKRKDHNSDL